MKPFTAWISLAVAILTHLLAVVWLLRGIIATNEVQAETLKSHQGKIEKCEQELVARAPAIYAVNSMRDDIKEIKVDLKDLKKTLVELITK